MITLRGWAIVCLLGAGLSSACSLPAQPPPEKLDPAATPQTECVSNADCPSDSLCSAGRCQGLDGSICSLDAHCASTEFCDGGNCAARVVTPSDDCSQHTDCDFGTYCQLGSGECVECLNDGHCDEPETCLPTGTCGQGESGCSSNFDCGALVCDTVTRACVQCVSSGDCPPSQTCRENSCFAAGGGSTEVPCSSQSQCDAFGQICDDTDSVCRACTGDPECGTDRLCAAGKCVFDPEAGGGGGPGGQGAECSTRIECADAMACYNGVCSPCTNDFMCFEFGDILSGDSYICEAQSGACLPVECSVADECPAGEGCYGGGHCGPCLYDDECRTGERCDAGAEACVPVVVPECEDNSGCNPGAVCLGGACGACTDTNQCDQGLVCNGGVCEVDGGHPGGCVNNSDCIATRACIDGICTTCTGTPQCDAGEICDNGDCLPDTGGGGTGEMGSACTVASQCATGLTCLVDATGGICTRTCLGSGAGGDADCPLGYACHNFDSGPYDGVQLCDTAARMGASAPGYPYTTAPGAACTANTCQTGECLSFDDTCARTCLANRDCNSDEVCYASWTSSAFEEQHYCVTSDTNYWLPAGAPCADGPDCDSGVCTGTCDDGKACNVSADCETGLCNGVCADHCRVSGDCAAGDVCGPWAMITTRTTVRGWVPVCMPAAYEGTGANGTSCTGDAQCASDFCVAGICTHTCGVSADCGDVSGSSCLPVHFPEGVEPPDYTIAFCVR